MPAPARLRVHHLVETFLYAPPVAFQNLVHALAPPGVSEEVLAMLASESRHYGAQLKACLRTGGFAGGQAWPEGVPVLTVYGRRHDAMTPAGVARDLGLDAGVGQGPLPVALIPQSCHFPMLENPAGLVAILHQWMLRIGAPSRRGG